MDRLYQEIIIQHFSQHEQMLFMAGPRQVGKTTLAKSCQAQYPNFHYLNYDISRDRELLFQGEQAVASKLGLHTVNDSKPLLVLDEFHKYKGWKNYLKGFFDQYKGQLHLLVIGSAKLNIYQRGGDSLMGRYLLYRIHPFSVAELLHQPLHDNLISQPKKIDNQTYDQLFSFGGFPDPLLKNDRRFVAQWRKLRRQQLLNEDILSAKHIQDAAHIEILAKLLRSQAGSQVSYTHLAKAVRVSVDTIRRWLILLEEFYYCFRIRPWFQNVKRSLVKEPKVYLWDWAEVEGKGASIENFVACHLFKAVQFWTDHGYGEFQLNYLRDKDKREVDFIVIRDNQPWFIVEVKTSDSNRLSTNLSYFKHQLKVPHAFQVVFNKPYVDKNCFDYSDPVIVSLKTFLSQLI